MNDASSLERWPGLQALADAPAELAHERAIWGKAHGQSTDYRWLARSKKFPGHEYDIERQLLLEPEDEPRDSTYWRSTPHGYYAFRLTRSRARDAAGRGGFGEKQILALSRSPNVPPALGALLLLPRAAKVDGEVWWEQRQNKLWVSPSYVLQLEAEHHPPLPISLPDLSTTIERGCQGLKEIGEERLATLYAVLLAGSTAWLEGCARPLLPESLAALLLPLPATLGVSLSLAGWIPSSRADAAKLGSWKVVAVPTGMTVRGAPHAASPTDEAREIARALLAADPRGLGELPSLAAAADEADEATARLAELADAELESVVDSGISQLTAPGPTASSEPRRDPDPPRRAPAAGPPAAHTAAPVVAGPRSNAGRAVPAVADWRPRGVDLLRPDLILPITELGDDAQPILRQLYEFARHAEHRWIEPGPFWRGGCRTLSPSDPNGTALRRWVAELDRWWPNYASDFAGPLADADPDQWSVKKDLLRSATLVLIPDPSTIAEVGELEGELVPPLAFLGLLGDGDRDRLLDLGEENLRRQIERSRSCSHPRLRAGVLQLLSDWRRRTESLQLHEILGAAARGR